MPLRDSIRNLQLTAVLAAIFCVWAWQDQGKDRQWDFNVFYAAGLAHQHHVDPYDLENLAKFDRDVRLPYIYPPYILPGLALLAYLPYSAALTLFTAAKILSLFIIITVWRRYFIGEDRDKILLLCMALGLTLSVWVDWLAGNICIFEQALLWSAFACFLKGRYHLFAALVVLASLPKLVPALFLGLLLLTRWPPRRAFLLLYSSILVLALGACFLLTPAYFENWIGNALVMNAERGLINPSSLALWSDLTEAAGVGQFAKLAYVLWAAAIAGFTYWALHDIPRDTRDLKIRALLILVLVFCLIAPRLKIYTVFMAIPSLLVFSSEPNSIRFPLWALALLPLAGMPYLENGITKTIVNTFTGYSPLLIVGACLWSALRQLNLERNTLLSRP